MYEDETYEVILDRMLARVSDAFDKREGSVIWDTHSPTAIELEILYIELDTLLREAYGDTASREYLILRCAERGITPYDATHAVLRGVFTPADVDVLGQRFNIGELNYVVIEKIADGEYLVQCETAGAVGNQYLGTMTPIDYIDGLETAELVALEIPGEDEEDTEALRERYFASFDVNAFGGNVADYIEKTNAIDGVGACKVKRVWNSDFEPSEMIPSSKVDSWYESVIGTLDSEVAEWLMAVYSNAKDKKLTVGGTVLVTIIGADYSAPTDTLIDAVQTALDPEQNAGEGYGIAPIGHVVNVKGVEDVIIDIKTDVTFASGYSWDNLQSSIEEAVDEYFTELKKEWADSEYLIVRISQLETRILGVTGVLDVMNTKLNGVEENLSLGEYEIPVLGAISG